MARASRATISNSEAQDSLAKGLGPELREGLEKQATEASHKGRTLKLTLSPQRQRPK